MRINFGAIGGMKFGRGNRSNFYINLFTVAQQSSCASFVAFGISPMD
jgi:hypothetical protein